MQRNCRVFPPSVLGPGFVIVVAVVVTAQLHSVVKVLLQGGGVGEQEHGGVEGGGLEGWRTRGLKGQEAGRCQACSQGDGEEGSRKKKKKKKQRLS